jgi:hypothetical protein
MNRGRHIVTAVVAATVATLSILVFSMLNSDPPVITSLEVNAARVFPSGSAEIFCIASGPGGAELTYEWSASGGVIQGTGSDITWIAPDSAGIYSVLVTVSDSRGGEDTDSVDIHVRANRPPTIASLTADGAWTTPGGSLHIACEAEDPDGDELAYVWTSTAGSISGTDEVVEWTAPEELGAYEITVVVGDPHGGSAARTLRLSVVTGQPPIIESLLVEADKGHKYLKKTASGYMVGEGKVFIIECTASHPDDLDLTYEWEWDGGEVSAIPDDGTMITWTAPYTRGGLTVTVTVSDIYGNMVSQSVELEVVSCSRFG